MILLLRKRTIWFMFTGLFFVGFGTYNIVLHPNMNKWKTEKLVITRVETVQKAVALTFDDGPDPSGTTAVLDSLAKHGAHATFFVVGSRAEKQPQLLKTIAAAGHEIANHSYSHSYSRFSSNKAEIFQQEIAQTNEIINRITAQNPVLFRSPGGYLSDALVALTKSKQITIAYWTWQQDSKDWKPGNSGASIAKHIIENIQPGQIILLHDGTSNSLETAKAVDLVLEALTKEGYKFVTLSDLIKLGNKE